MLSLLISSSPPTRDYYLLCIFGAKWKLATGAMIEEDPIIWMTANEAHKKRGHADEDAMKYKASS
jgi:hypothetical protein